jgi:hypothetical protein
MKLSFLSSWRGYREGRSYDVPTGAALIYLRRGIAVEAVEFGNESAGKSTDGNTVVNPPSQPKKPKPVPKRNGRRR